MDQGAEIKWPEELPFEVDEEKWGVFLLAEVICPGLYLLITLRGLYYVALEEAAKKIFSAQAMVYGIHSRDAVFFPTHDGKGEDHVIRYEIGRYLALQGCPVPAYAPLWACALDGAGEFPEYFGAPVPPVETPHGRVTRYLEMDKGIFLLETEACQQMLGVSYPIWNAELSSNATRRAEMTAYDRSNNIERTMGYLFFSRRICEIALYELYPGHAPLKEHIVSLTALISAIWRHCPAYAIAANLRKQMGFGGGNLRDWLVGGAGLDAPELERLPKGFIPYIEDTGQTDFLKLPDSWRLDRG